jgi:hypothetical protein
MSHLMKAAKIANDMEERRQLMHSVYGDNYASVTKTARGLIKIVAEREGKSIIQAALSLGVQAEKDGHGAAVSLLIAAALDLIEEGK